LLPAGPGWGLDLDEAPEKYSGIETHYEPFEDTFMWNNHRRKFLMFMSALFARSAAAADQPARGFLQITRYDRMPEKYFKPYFDAIDKYYTPALARAPGLLMMKRFRHYDLPEKICVQLWESEQAAKWQDSETARELWKQAMNEVPRGLSPEYREPMHSFAHYHYILEASFKG
jgi:hypothetical protein